MNIVLPKDVQKKVQRKARERGISESEYVRKAVESALTSDDDLRSEMQAWEDISPHDFHQFAKARKL